MRKLVVGILLGLISIASSAARARQPSTRFVTVAQMEQALTAAHGVKDKKLAREIADMKLTERLSDAEETQLSETLPGKKSRLALLAIADESAFLDPPPSEISNLPPPSRADQIALINKVVAYATHAMHELPNFFAKRTTVWFAGTPEPIAPPLHYALFGSDLRPTDGGDRLATTGTTRAVVFYRDGREGYAKASDQLEECAHQIGSNVWGEFGEVLGRVGLAMTKGTVAWSHWEQGAIGPVAVFSWQAEFGYKMPTFCPNQGEMPPLLIHAHGEVAINPVNGTVLRVTEMWRYRVVPPDWADVSPNTQESDTLVEYGTENIGGRVYLCPHKSVSVVQGTFVGRIPDVRALEHRFALRSDPAVEYIDDINFTDYHVFRSTVRIVPAGGASP